MADVSRAIKLCGTDEADPPSRLLRAGPLSVELEAGNLRYIRFSGIEVLRGISFLVRDANWGTLSADISELKVEESRDAFTVAYRGRCDDGSIGLVYDAVIHGAAIHPPRHESPRHRRGRSTHHRSARDTQP